KPDAKIRECFLHGGDLSSDSYCHSPRRSTNTLDGLIDSVRDPSQVFANHVRRDRDHSLTVKPVIFSDHGAIPNLSNVPDQRMERITSGDWDVCDVLNRCDLRLWQFHLHLISDS